MGYGAQYVHESSPASVVDAKAKVATISHHRERFRSKLEDLQHARARGLGGAEGEAAREEGEDLAQQLKASDEAISLQTTAHLLTEANGGVPDKYAGGDALNGQLELVVAARLPSRCTTNGAVAGLSAGLNDLGLRVRDANLSLLSGVAHNAFHVILPAGDPRPAAERAREGGR